MRILVVEDHVETRELVARHFGRSSYAVATAGSCRDAEDLLAEREFEVVVLDVMLPDGSGIDLCARLRQGGAAVPILLLTARGDVRDRVGGLEAGADDYLVKPFALAELLARVRALGRRGPIRRERTLSFGVVSVDPERREVCVSGQPIPLTAREISIVQVLASRRGVVSREFLLDSVWGETGESAQNSLDVLIGRIRRKLGQHASVLRTVRGLGYSLQGPE
jgi:DNA-binding response OmpR family regulator